MLIYDCEIKKMILGRGENINPELEYCAGWTDYANMGISVVCALDTSTGIMHTLLVEDEDDHAQMLQRLIDRADYVVGFNNARFDDNLLAAYGITVPKSKSYDIYQQVVACVSSGYKRGYGLDAIATANGIPGKGDISGALAPVLYQRGDLNTLYSAIG